MSASVCWHLTAHVLLSCCICSHITTSFFTPSFDSTVSVSSFDTATSQKTTARSTHCLSHGLPIPCLSQLSLHVYSC